MSLRRERWLLLGGAGAFAVVAVPWFLRGSSGALVGVAALMIAAIAYLGAYVRPSVYLTLGLVISIFSGVWQYVGIAGLPIKPDRLLILTGLAALIVRAPGARDRGPIRLGPAHVLMVLAATYAVISALISGTLTTTEGLFGLLDKFGIFPYLMFALAPVAFAHERDRNTLLVGLTVLGGYLGLTALFETLNVNSLVFPHFINDQTIGLHLGRARGPFLEAVANGLAIFGCGCAAAVAVTRWKGAARWAAAAVVVLSIMGVLFTITRSIWIGSAAGALVVLIGFGEVRRYLLPTVAAAGIVLGGAFLFVPSLSGKASQRATDQLPVWDRQNTNATALRMIADRPLLGWGWDTFLDKSPPYFRQAPTYPMTGLGKGVHNVALSNAVELGLIGFVLWAAALLMGVGGAIVSRGPPEMLPWRMFLTAFAVQWLIAAMLGPLPYAMPNLLLWMLAGVALATPQRRLSRSS